MLGDKIFVAFFVDCTVVSALTNDHHDQQEVGCQLVDHSSVCVCACIAT